MEDIFTEFPNLGENIINEIDQKSLTNFRMASRKICKFLVSGKFLWKQIILKNIEKYREESWKIIFKEETPVQVIQELAKVICKIKSSLEITPLHVAVWSGNLEICQFLLQNTLDKNSKDGHGKTPLHWAATKGYSEICRILLENHVDKNSRDNIERTPLHYAVQQGHSKVVNILLKNQVDKNPVDNLSGHTPLHLSAFWGYLEVSRILLENEVDKNPRDKISGQTPLHIAAKEGHSEVCNILIKNEVEIGKSIF